MNKTQAFISKLMADMKTAIDAGNVGYAQACIESAERLLEVEKLR